MSAPKLLHIAPSLSGSIGRTVLDAAQAVIAAGGSALVASPGGAMVPDLLRLRANHIELATDGSPLMARFGLPGKLARAIRDRDIDLIQSHSPTSAWIAGALAGRLGLKWIASLHRPFDATAMIARHVERRQSRADALIASSEHVAADIRRRLPQVADKLDVIPPGINFDRFDPAIVRADRVIKLAHELRVPDGAHVVLCPGRFLEDRGQKTLIHAMKLLDREDAFCLLLGSVGAPLPFEKELEREIVTNGLAGRVQIGPHIDDMPAAYMLADVVVSTGGIRQGFSRTIVEAQAMGRPVVCEQGGGAAEAVVDGITGWVAREGDAVEMARAVRSALSLSVERRGELARAAQNNSRIHYGLPQSTERLMRLYQRLLA